MSSEMIIIRLDYRKWWERVAGERGEGEWVAGKRRVCAWEHEELRKNVG